MRNFKTTIWEAVYVLCLSLILANYWVGFHLGSISPLPFLIPLTYLVAPFCGALAYLFVKSVRKAFYATLIFCVLACFITALALSIPAYQGIVDMEVSTYLSLRIGIIMFFYTFPLAFTGSMIAAYLFPD